MSIVVGLGLVLLLAILYMIFRIGNLLAVAKGEEKRVDGFNKINALLFPIFAVTSIGGFLWYSYTRFSTYELPVASLHGKITDGLFWITMWITVIAFILISLAMFWFLYRYQYREGQKAEYFTDSHKLEIVWTVIPAIVLALLIFRGLRVWNDITGPASEQAEVIELVGQQFAWTARYPGIKDKQLGTVNYKLIDASNEFGLDLTDKNTFDDFKSLELHLPAGREVLLKIRAKDVLHSVFLPHFRVKMDAVPGMVTQFKFTPTLTTQEMRDKLGNPKFNYEMACAEICGKGHFSMRFPVIVDTPEDFEKWKSAQESWLKQNPDYLNRVPVELREAAMIKAGIPLQQNAAGTTVLHTISISK
jgi:cytochrome c oxidase subunit 2